MAAVEVLAYSDSAQTFGAEMVFCDVVRALTSSPELSVTTAVSSRNEPLWRAMSELPAAGPLDVTPHPLRRPPIGVWNPARGVRVRAALSRTWDVMVVNLAGVEYGAAPLLWAHRRAAARIGILHLHQPITHLSPDSRLSGVRDALAGRLLRRLDHLLLISPTGCETALPAWRLAPGSCSVLPLLRRSAERVKRADARRALDLPERATIVGVVGRVGIAQKGHDVFVEAARELARTHDSSVQFVVIGEGPDEARVRQAVADAGLGARFHFRPTVRPIDVALGALDLIAFPSRFEGLPLTAIEALSVGLAGVASNVDGLGAVWPAQWLVEPDDSAALSAAVTDLLNSDPSDRDRIVHEAYEHSEVFVRDDLGPELVPLVLRMAEPRVRDPHR